MKISEQVKKCMTPDELWELVQYPPGLEACIAELEQELAEAQFELRTYRESFPLIEKELAEAKEAAEHWEKTCEAQWETSNEWQEKFISTSAELAEANNANLEVLKLAAIKNKENDRLREALQATHIKLRDYSTSIGSRIENAVYVIEQALEGET